MDTRSFFAKGWPVKVALWIGKLLPAWAAVPVSVLGARLITLLKPDMYHNARANLHHVLGADVSPKVLKQTLYRLFKNTSRRYFEFFYNMGRGRVQADTFTPPVRFTPQSKQYLEQALASERGLFILACHMSNFDLAGIMLSQYMPVPLQVLSLASPSQDIALFNELRARCGVMMTPITPQSLRDAMARLREGGAAATGPDYPVADEEAWVMFFDAPAHLPRGYIRIPMRTRSLVTVLSTHYEHGVYWIQITEPMDMVQTGDRKKDIDMNMRKVLDRVENFIRQHPDEWMMFVPVWDAETVDK